ncbi:MAG TPA: MSMEG_0568 family radical SAM protein [Acidimicrobiales bacterium]|nr:MSMEG_0568 family radical SAM protein [Acidimicrobiales bacterium]
MLSVEAAADLAVRGVRVAAPVHRGPGAGPSDDGHVVIGDRAMALATVPDSPWAIGDGQLTYDGEVVDAVDARPVDRPAFYDLRTADGVPYEQIARLHGDRVLATTVVQTCIRYSDEATRCRFCAIEQSLAAGATTRVKSPAQLAEVAEAAVRLDGVEQLVMTTGTAGTPDRGARHLARCAAAVHEVAPGLPMQAQIEPPEDLVVLEDLRRAGVTALGIHIETLDERARARWTPGKATVSRATYDRAWDRAVEVFGRNRVSTYVLLGLGEDPGEVVAGCTDLARRGIYPFVVPYRPIAGTLAHAEGVPAPSPGYVADVTRRVAAALRAADMRGVDQGAGCAACGACSALTEAGG